MSEGILKDHEQGKELNFGDILHKLETFEQVYPYFTNMIEQKMDLNPEQNHNLNSFMKKEKRD